MEDLLEYFPNYSKNELPNRDYLWSVLATLRGEATEHLIKQAIEHRSISTDVNKDELVEISPQILKEIKSVSAQKSKKEIFIINFYSTQRQNSISSEKENYFKEK